MQICILIITRHSLGYVDRRFSHHHSSSGTVMNRVESVINGQPNPVFDGYLVTSFQTIVVFSSILLYPSSTPWSGCCVSWHNGFLILCLTDCRRAATSLVVCQTYSFVMSSLYEIFPNHNEGSLITIRLVALPPYKLSCTHSCQLSVCLYPFFLSTRPSDRNQILHTYSDRYGTHLNKLAPRMARKAGLIGNNLRNWTLAA